MPKKIAATFHLSSALAFSGVYCILISLVILSQFPMRPTLGVGSTRHNRRSKQQQQQQQQQSQKQPQRTQRLRRIPSKKLDHHRDGDTMQG
jgi:hypothetical protein